MVIILLGAVGALAIAYPAFEEGILKISDSFREQNKNYAQVHETSLSVENITLTGNCVLYNLTIGINNTGSEGITIGKLSFFDNGEVLGNTLSGLLAPRKGINITYENMTSAASSHTIKVVAGNGVSAYGEYDC